MSDSIPCFLISLTLTFNLNTWIRYYYIIHDKIHGSIASKKLSKRKIIIDLSIMVIFIVDLSIFGVLLAYYLMYDNVDRFRYLLFLLYGCLFTSFGFAFAIPGFKSLRLIKKHFNGFYQSYKCYIYITTIGLSVPLLFRGIIDLVDHEIHFLDNHYYLTVIIITILGKFLLFLCQMTSMVFGFIR